MSNEFTVTWFDPGGTIGWAWLSLSLRAFSRPEHLVTRNVVDWDCGEFSGPENKQIQDALNLAKRNTADTDFLMHHIGGEDFQLTQTVGGRNLLSPVRINAVLAWECEKIGLRYQLQDRALRTNITSDRLIKWGFLPPGRSRRWPKQGKGKDAFAAMQHAIVHVRRLKEKSKARPWKLTEGGQLNARWDCACEQGKRCDLVHP